MSIELPRPTGPYAVGRTSFDFADESRPETLAPPGVAGPRRLVAWVWYPAVAEPHSRAAPYLPPGWEASDSVMGARLGTASLECHFIDGAVPAQGRFAVLLFSAAGFSPLSYAATVEELASHGFVVVSICHTYEAPVSVFADGIVVPARADYLAGIAMPTGDMNATFAFRAGVATLKSADMASVATALGTGHSPVASMIDPRRIGAFGHSLGGNAALEWCRNDDRCLAAVNLDGAIWTETGRTGLTKPAMILAAEHPEMQAPPEALVAAGAFSSVEWALAERTILFDGWQKVVDTARGGQLHTLSGTRHANFADLQFVRLPEDSPLRNVLGAADPVAVWRQTCDHLLSFFGAHLH